MLVQAIAGGIAAGIAAYLSVAFLTRYFRSNDLRPFGWYCVIVGAICFVLRERESSHESLAIVLAVVFFVLGILYGMGKINSLRNREPRIRITSPTWSSCGCSRCSV